MKKSALAIITYNRLHALQACLAGLLNHCPQYPTAIFDDCGQRDGTATYLQNGQLSIKDQPEINAKEYSGQHIGPSVQVFMGQENLGVTGQANRAIRWFMESTDCDHLCLLNDDLHVLGDFVNFYGKAHDDLGVGLLCFCDFTSETYRWVTVRSRGYQVKLLPRMTGIMMSFTRPVVEKIGYFDARFGRFGEEHCDFSIRARLAGFVNLDGQQQNCLDVEPKTPLLRHQEVETSLAGYERVLADQEAGTIMRQICLRYGQEHYYRPFLLRLPKLAGGYGGGGIPVAQLTEYNLVRAPA